MVHTLLLHDAMAEEILCTGKKRSLFYVISSPSIFFFVLEPANFSFFAKSDPTQLKLMPPNKS